MKRVIVPLVFVVLALVCVIASLAIIRGNRPTPESLGIAEIAPPASLDVRKTLQPDDSTELALSL